MKSMRSEYSGTTAIKQAINKDNEELINEFKNNKSNTQAHKFVVINREDPDIQE